MSRTVRRALAGLVVSLPAALFNCVGDSSGGPDGATGADASDATMGNDVVNGDAANCTPGCIADASTLRTCTGNTPTDTPCNVGCLSTPSDHCGVFNPTGLVEPTDFTSPLGLKDFDPFPADAGNGAPVIGGPSYLFYTDTGEIDDVSNGAANGTIRPANVDPTTMTVDGPTGIAYRLASYDGGANKLGIFVFKDLYFRGGEFHFTGMSPVAFVAQGDILVSGVINVANTDLGGAGPHCLSGAGGGAGGAYDADGGGLGGGGGGGSNTSSGSGGGGGGSGAAGGAGGANVASGSPIPGGAGGTPFSGGFDPLLGGGGAGGGGGLYNGSGGAGGGALALFANGTITITQGVGKQSGVNAGGCGGSNNGLYYNNGGGGAGGAILLQAPTIIGLGAAGVAANGGGGASCTSSLGGPRGGISTTPAPGVAGGGTCGAGGNGGAGTTAATVGTAPSTAGFGGGGGGGVGRIEIGTYAPFVADGGFVLSPTPGFVPLPVE